MKYCLKYFLLLALNMLIACNEVNVANNNNSSAESDNSKGNNSPNNNYQKQLTLVQTAEAQVGNGVFERGCDYATSLSDHAPVVFKEHAIASWNIASRALKKLVAGKFLGHKFKLLASGESIDEQDADYEKRLASIATAINEIMSKNNLDYMTLQEVPGLNIKFKGAPEKDGNFKFRKVLTDTLKNHNLDIVYATSESGDARTTIDSAIVIASNMKKNLIELQSSEKNRWQVACLTSTKTCIVSVHQKYADTQTDTRTMCADMLEKVKNLKANGYRKILFAGDFNRSALWIQQSCQNIAAFVPTIYTFAGEAQSCGGEDANNKQNMGTHNIDNIDLLCAFQ